MIAIIARLIIAITDTLQKLTTKSYATSEQSVHM